MDARIIAEAVELKTSIAQAVITTVINVADTVMELVGQYSPALVLAPLLSLSGTSRNAVSPDHKLNLRDEGCEAT